MSSRDLAAIDDFLTVAEVAKILKLNEQTVRNWIADGSLPALRVGRRVRIRRHDFQALINSEATNDKPTHTTYNAQAFWDGVQLPADHLA